MTIISAAQLREVMSMGDAIECLRAGYAAQDQLGVVCPERTFIRPQDGPPMFFGSMPVYSAGYDKFVVKVASFHGQNKARGLPSIHGVVVVQDASVGTVEAIFDATAITALRTAATSGLVMDLLAPDHVGTAAIIGTGAQAAAQLEALFTVRRPTRVRVYSRDAANVTRFIAASLPLAPPGCVIEAAASVSAAIDDAQIICTATTSYTPLFDHLAVRDGAHISAIGQHNTVTREFPLELLPRSLLVVEDRVAAVLEAGAYNQDGLEIRELLAVDRGPLKRRMSIFASVGTAFQDMCVAVHAARLWQQKNGGPGI